VNTPPPPIGTDVWELFPFDGQRTWTYTSTDAAVGYRLVATSTGEGEDLGDATGYRVRYDSDAGDALFELVWSSDTVDGVRVHEIDGVAQDPPVVVATDDMNRDDAVTSGAWTSTFDGFVQCPIAMAADWPECGELVVAGEGSLAGTWWAARGNGVAAFEPAGGSGRWELSSAACEGDCDGSW
jgi:hypothetical protein